MTHSLKPPFLLLTASLLGGAAVAQETKPTVEERLAALEKNAGGDTMRAYWKDGLRFESADKRYKVKIGGRIHYDIAFFDPDNATKTAVEQGTTRIEDGSELRRARIEMSGEVADNVDWALALDFGGGSTNFRNAYVGVKDVGIGSLRAGQFKEPYSLDQITSSNNIMFMERSLMNAFVPAFNAGIMLFDVTGSERLTWSVGGFRTGSDNGEVSRGDGEWAGTARVTGLPVLSDDSKDYVHVGVGLSHRSPTADAVTFSSRPEANLAPAYVTANGVPTETLDLIGAELAWVQGPVTLAGEYTMASIDAPSGVSADPDFAGYYVQASWFLTGESRPYRKANGCFDAIKPLENAFGKEGGRGAWELATRYSAIDLTDEGINGGELSDITVGVNWYLNPNARVMMNYVMADLEPAAPASDGDTNILEFRFQYAF